MDGGHSVTAGGAQQLQYRYWELRERLRFRDVFMAELGKAVIGTYEEVVATDVMMIVIRWAVGWYGLCEFSPLQLDIVLQLLPG